MFLNNDPSLLFLLFINFPVLSTLSVAPQSVNGISSHEEEEINELQDDDRELFSDQLSSIGMLGRVAADHCIPLLTRLHPHSLCYYEVIGIFCVMLAETVQVFPVLTLLM